VILVFSLASFSQLAAEEIDQDHEFSKITEYLCNDARYLECTSTSANKCREDMESNRVQCANLMFLTEYGKPIRPQTQEAILKCAMASHTARIQSDLKEVSRCFIGK
jgi:hypothetical protein